MWNPLGLTLLLLYGSAYCVAAIAWLAAMSYLIRTLANRKPGIPLWSVRLVYIPLNIVFRPDLLTERGQLCRRRFGISALVFLGALVAGVVLTALAALLR